MTVRTLAGRGRPTLGDGADARLATIEGPFGLAQRGDQMLVVELTNDRLRVIDGTGVIRTLAGTGSAESQSMGDGGPATQATLRLPRDVIVGPDGSVYVSDTNHYVIRRIAPDGTITRVAGTGSFQFGGDGGPALQAGFASPRGLALDADGRLYVADGAANRLRRIAVDGTITTVAGNGEPQTSGDGLPATLASLDNPSDLAIDRQGNVLIAGSGTGPLRRFDPLLGNLLSLPGTEGALAVHVGDGAIFFTTQTQVKAVDPVTLQVRVVAGTSTPGFSPDGTPVGEAKFDGLTGILARADGDLLVSDFGNDRVRRISDGLVTTGAGTGVYPGGDGSAGPEATVFDSQGVAWDAHGNLFFSDFPHGRIRRIGCDGIVTTVAGDGEQQSAGDGGHPAKASLTAPQALVFDPHGQLLFIDATDSVGVVRAVTPGVDGVIDGSADETILTVAGRVRPRSEADHGAADGKPATQAVFMAARGLAIDAAGRLIISDFLDHRVRVVVPGKDGRFDGGADEVISTLVGTGADERPTPGTITQDTPFRQPTWSCGGPDGAVFIRDSGNDAPVTVWKLDAGDLSEVAQVDMLVSFACGHDGALYMALGRSVERLWPGNGTRELLAGNGMAGFSGDGGPASQASFQGVGYLDAGPFGVAVADNGNFRVRLLTGTG